MNDGMPSELKKCQSTLEELQKKSQQKHMKFWSQVDPQYRNWDETAAGYVKSFDLIEKYQDAPAQSSEAFLFSNSVESCLEFSKEYSGVLRKQELMGLGIVALLLSVSVVFFIWMFRRKRRFNLLLCLLVGFGVGEGVHAKADPTLRVYAYDALTGRNSFGEYLEKKFFEKYGARVQFVSFGTAGEGLNQILLEGNKTKADLVMGIDEVLFKKVERRDFFQKAELRVFEKIEPDLKSAFSQVCVPFDYGYVSFVYDDSRTKISTKISLKDFPELLKDTQKITVQDPRTSSLGLEFLIWTFEKLGEGATRFWTLLAPHILTVSPGWSGAYELFLRKQADFVISYTTSPAYHKMRENKQSIKPVFFDEGHFKQIEGICVLNSSSQKSLAMKFIEMVLSDEAQAQLPTFQWMYPARRGTSIPAEFREIPIPKEVKVDWNRVTSNREQWVRDWTLLLSKDPK